MLPGVYQCPAPLEASGRPRGVALYSHACQLVCTSWLIYAG
jgi:hypothetical protein